MIRRALAIAALALCAVSARAAEPFFDGDRLRLQLVPRNLATISGEVSGLISALPLREGDAFAKDDLLVTFDCSILRAQLKKLEASAEGAAKALAVNSRLSELNSNSSLELDLSAIKVRETEAEVAAMKLTLGKCSIRAPFSGRVAKLYAYPHEYATSGKPLLDLIETENLEIKLIAPSKWLAWLKPGAEFKVAIDEVGKSYNATVQRIGAKVDPLSQSIQVVGVLAEQAPELLPGMSGWAQFPKPKK